MGASHVVVVCFVSLATAFGCLSLTVQLLLFRKNHARLACSVVKRPHDGSLSLPTFADFGQPQGLSLRYDINYNLCTNTGLPCKGSCHFFEKQKMTEGFYKIISHRRGELCSPAFNVGETLTGDRRSPPTGCALILILIGNYDNSITIQRREHTVQQSKIPQPGVFSEPTGDYLSFRIF